ncbi:MAG: hypothetical protein IJY50_09755 [Clostridia bacterium]|nr:hypothetical protein [Clostridia bacterium]
MELYTETRDFDNQETGEKVHFEQLILRVRGFDIPIKPVFKSDRRLLLALVGKE